MSPDTPSVSDAPELSETSKPKPLIGLSTVTVNWPAAGPGAAQIPTKVPLIASTSRWASVAGVSAGYAAAPSTVPPMDEPPEGLPPFVVAPLMSVPAWVVQPTVIHTTSPSPKPLPVPGVPASVTVHL